MPNTGDPGAGIVNARRGLPSRTTRLTPSSTRSTHSMTSSQSCVAGTVGSVPRHHSCGLGGAVDGSGRGGMNKGAAARTDMGEAQKTGGQQNRQYPPKTRPTGAERSGIKPTRRYESS
ncbi:hypothetical protein G6F40_017410 [Rhizopus arrhizus]|nr:hypothetical protein G6F40_017410 [Rhizopus arrhizus]